MPQPRRRAGFAKTRRPEHTGRGTAERYAIIEELSVQFVQPQSGGLETRRELGGRTGCYSAQECLGFAPTG
jgi:hypothetical protein